MGVGDVIFRWIKRSVGVGEGDEEDVGEGDEEDDREGDGNGEFGHFSFGFVIFLNTVWVWAFYRREDSGSSGGEEDLTGEGRRENCGQRAIGDADHVDGC